MRHGLHESRGYKRARRSPSQVRPVLVWVAALLLAVFVGYVFDNAPGACDRMHERGETGRFCGPPPAEGVER